MSHIKPFFLVISFFLFYQFGFSQVGINTSTPLSTLDINGNLNVKEIGIVNPNVVGSAIFNGGTFANKTPINDGVYISLSPSGANNDFELPDAATVPGRIYIIRNIASVNWAFLYSAGTSKFFPKNSMNATYPDGIGNPSYLKLPNTGDLKTIIVISDGENWSYFF
ncbi:hypothetical protein [Flavobacterium sp.]|jgi:hypothetical protein|uniref:hypothetical protein n=1 Tax=Flavobacterium sp. TaxID=239 RepID=UPI0037BE90EB